MDKAKILEFLKTVTYPGFSRDIVSFGMVDDVIVDGDSVAVKLKITTQQEEKKSAVVKEVEQILKETKFFTDVQVSVVEGTPTSTGGSAPQSPQAQPLLLAA